MSSAYCILPPLSTSDHQLCSLLILFPSPKLALPLCLLHSIVTFGSISKPTPQNERPSCMTQSLGTQCYPTTLTPLGQPLGLVSYLSLTHASLPSCSLDLLFPLYSLLPNYKDPPQTKGFFQSQIAFFSYSIFRL